MINNINISYAKEKNLSLLDDDSEVWDGELPFKEGSVFPNAKLQARLDRLKTAKLLYENRADEIYINLLNVYPEIDPTTGWQVRELISNLPYFKNSIDSWVGILCSHLPSIDFNDDNLDSRVGQVISESNFNEFIITEIANRFLYDIGVYKIGYDLNGKPEILYIEPKNVIIYNSKKHYNNVEVVVVFNEYTKGNKDYVEFIEYHYNGLIVRNVFEYNDGTLGRRIDELYKSEYWIDESVGISPIVLFKHNCIGNKIYGTSMFEYWSPSLITVMRELQNLFRLGEKAREMIRKVPESAIKRDNVTGGSMFYNKGTVTYPDGVQQTPSIEYILPDLPIEKAIQILDKAIKNISIDTKLGPVFFDIEKLGTNLSAKSIEAAMYPTKVEGSRIMSEVKTSLEDVIVRLACLANLSIVPSEFNIIWMDGFPKDVREYTEAIQLRLGGKQSLSIEDAIMKLDGVTSKEALIKARYLQGLDYSSVIYDSEERLNTNDVDETVTNNTNKDDASDTTDKLNKDTYWETQVPFPTNILMTKGLRSKDLWMLRKLRKSH